MTEERRCSDGSMSAEIDFEYYDEKTDFNSLKLLDLLDELHIPVFDEDGRDRTESDLINDLFRAYGRGDLWLPGSKEARAKIDIVDALNWMATGGNFSAVQKVMLEYINEDVKTETQERNEEESFRMLDEFYDSFAAAGGGAV